MELAIPDLTALKAMIETVANGTAGKVENILPKLQTKAIVYSMGANNPIIRIDLRKW